MLERLAPTERAAFLLHEVFDYDYSEISTVLGKSEANVRQMVHRARLRVRREQRRFPVDEDAHRRLLERFLTAVRTSDRETLLELFAEDATWTADGGGKVAAVREVLHGGVSISTLLADIGRRWLSHPTLTFDFVPINGETGILLVPRRNTPRGHVLRHGRFAHLRGIQRPEPRQAGARVARGSATPPSRRRDDFAGSVARGVVASACAAAGARPPRARSSTTSSSRRGRPRRAASDAVTAMSPRPS